VAAHGRLFVFLLVFLQKRSEMIPDVDNDSIVYLNGELLRLGDAKVSVLDRGFIFGDGIYEVVPAYEGRPFFLNHHLDRLQRSLKAIALPVDMSHEDWEALVQGMLDRAGPGNQMVYIQVTRGVAKREHGFPLNTTPTIFSMTSPFSRPDAATREQGLSAIGIEDIRWMRCEIKSVSLLGNVLAKQCAVQAGVDDVIQFRDGWLSEGSSSNIWVVRQGVLLGPVRNNLILEGVRYGILEGLAQQAGVEFESRPISRQEVEQADELLLSSATKEVLPITRYDGKPVGSGRPGPVYKALSREYDELLDALTSPVLRTST
jgi:D-alanine transaminase